MVTKKAIIKNQAGIHVRPSGAIFQEIDGHKSVITLTKDGEELELSSVMSLLALGLCEGDEVGISVDGSDEVDLADKLVSLFEKVYDFPPRE